MANKARKQPYNQIEEANYPNKGEVSVNTDVLNLISDFVIIINRDTRILWSNDAFKTSLPNQKVVYFRDILFSNDIENFNSFISNSHDLKTRVKQENNPIWINWKKQTIEYNGEEAYLVIGNRSALINESNDDFNELAQLASFGYCEYSSIDKYIHLNPAICKILGLPNDKKELHIEDYIQMVHPVDNLKFVNWLNYSASQSDNNYQSTEYRIINKQDKIKHIKSFVKNNYYGGQNRRFVFIHDITEYKKSINDLKYSEYRLRSIFENAPIGIVYITASGEILDINPTGLKILGSPSKEETRKINFLKFPSLKQFGITQKVKECINNATSIDYNTIYKSKWGKESYLKFKIEPLVENNEVSGALIIAEDVTEQNIVKKQLTDTENRYLRTLQLIPDTILVFDSNFNAIDFHKPADRECKLFSEHLLNNSIKENTYIDVFNAIKTKTKSVIKNNKPETFKFKVTIRQEQLAFESRISQIEDNIFMVIIKEVTEQNQTKQQLADREIKLEEASKIAQLGWYEVLGNEGFYYGSHYTHKIFFDKNRGNPISKDELITVIHPDDKETFFETVSSNIAAQNKEFSWEYRLITPNGTLKYIWTKTYINYDEDGNLVSRFGVVQDITETKTSQIALQQSQERLIEAKNKAEESDHLKSAFLANMSHEIRTPLNAILGFSSLLEVEDYSKEEHQSFVKTINKNGQYLLNIINDIIDFSKIEANQLQLNFELVNINSVIAETHNLLFNLVPENVEFLYHNGLPDEKAIIVTDDQRVSQVLINLINNSFKFTDSGSITFGYYLNEAKTELIFNISDTGWGIEESKIPEIFTRFHQLDHIKQGAGLGLSISKGLVNLLGGRIWLESEYGKGTTFYFSLPYKQ